LRPSRYFTFPFIALAKRKPTHLAFAAQIHPLGFQHGACSHRISRLQIAPAEEAMSKVSFKVHNADPISTDEQLVDDALISGSESSLNLIHYMRYSNAELKWLKFINFLAFITNMIVIYGVGVLGSILFDLPTNDEVSEKYATLITPIGWSFSIWGVIFLMQFLWVLQQFYCSLPENYVQAVTTVRFNYVLMVLTQIAWTLAFSNEMLELSLFFMVLILYNLFTIVRSLSQLEPPAVATMASRFLVFLAPALAFFFTEFPFVLNFGWILAATLVNINVVLVSMNLENTAMYYAALGSVLILLVSTILLFCWNGTIVVPLVICWALFGIYMELQAPSEGIVMSYTEAQQQNVQYAALGGITVLALMLLVGGIRSLLLRTRRNGSAGSSTRDEADYVRARDVVP
jgi:translocator protein